MNAITLDAPVPDHVPADRVFRFDLYDRQPDPRLSEDIHAGLRYLLRDAPDVFFTPCNTGHWVITRSDLIAEVLKNSEYFSSSRSDIPRIEHYYKAIPLNFDPPEHTPYRQILMRYFGPKAINTMSDKIRARARELIDAVKDEGGCDFVDKIGIPLPVTIFMEMIGWPVERLKEFRALVDRMFSGPNDEERAAVVGEILGELTPMLLDRQANPRDDMMSTLLRDEVDGRTLSLEEVQALCFFLFAAGLDTVANAASFIFRQLGGLPDLQARLAADPSRMDDFIKEGLRVAGVVNTVRIVVKDVELGGAQLRAGDMIAVMLPLVGLDERLHANPMTFDIDRKSNFNMIFGMGVHLCAGHNLARLELKILAEEWVKAIPSFAIAPGHREVFRLGPVMAVRDLPLVWPAGATAEAGSRAAEPALPRP